MIISALLTKIEIILDDSSKMVIMAFF